MWNAAKDQFSTLVSNVGFTGAAQVIKDPQSRALFQQVMGVDLNAPPETLNQQYLQISQQNLGIQSEYLGLSQFSTYGEAANRIINSPANAPYAQAIQNYAGSFNAFTKLQAALSDIKQNGGKYTAADFKDIQDSISQIETSGNQITAGQIYLSKDAQSLPQQLQGFIQYLDGEGGDISQSMADQMVSIAQKTYDAYSSSYQKSTSGLKGQLQNVNGVNLNQYFPIGDFSQVGTIQALTNMGSGSQFQMPTTQQNTQVGSTIMYNGSVYNVQGINADGSYHLVPVTTPPAQ
jgi:hypothetical protein